MSTFPTPINTEITVEVSGISADQREQLAAILKDVRTSVDRLARAAKRWMDLPEKARTKIVEQTNPSFREFWRKLELVGEGTLHPQLATVGGSAARLLGKLPLEQQDHYLRNLVPVVVPAGKRWDVRLIDVAIMSEDQRKQVFKVTNAGVEVRDEAQQKVWLSDRAARALIQEHALEAVKKVDRTGWKVERGRVWVKPQATENGLTKKQVLQILKDLED